MSQTWWIVPVTFVGGSAVGGVLAWHWRSRQAAATPSVRQPAWPLVLSTLLFTVLLLGALGYGVVRLRFAKTQVSGASMEEAVTDFRRARGSRESRGTRAGKAPPGGVYAYAASGYYEANAPLLGKERRDLPATVPGILVPHGDCWELTHRYFQQHHWTGRFCHHATEGLRLEWVQNKNEMFSMKSESRSRCEPRALAPPGRRPGEPWALTCAADPPRKDKPPRQVKMEGVILGEVTISVGGAPQPALHVRRTFSMKGVASGSMSQDLWLAKGSGMLLKLRVQGEGSGLGRFFSDYTLTLKSLTPTE